MHIYKYMRFWCFFFKTHPSCLAVKPSGAGLFCVDNTDLFFILLTASCLVRIIINSLQRSPLPVPLPPSIQAVAGVGAAEEEGSACEGGGVEGYGGGAKQGGLFREYGKGVLLSLGGMLIVRCNNPPPRTFSLALPPSSCTPPPLFHVSYNPAL